MECTNGILKFSHDRIQQTVYELLVDESLIAQQKEHGQQNNFFSPPPVITPEIPAEPRKLLSLNQSEHTQAMDLVHYHFGTLLKNHWEDTEEERFLFLAVEQLDRVSDRYLLAKLTQEETLGIMTLNHEASKLAKKKGGPACCGYAKLYESAQDMQTRHSFGIYSSYLSAGFESHGK